jgi:pimeloyl-ACP methyl ester carboxylesterase
VLLCYPPVYEYMGTHWAFRKLAGLLARDGFHVLRFDYYGTGDSAGESHQGSVADWLENIREAAAELRDIASVREISIVGMRLGATLAANATADGLPVRNLVLWDPAVDGKSHIRELRHLERVRYGMLRQGPQVNPLELLGYPFPAERSGDIERLRIVSSSSAQRVHIFVSEDRPEYRQLINQLRDREGHSPSFQLVADQARTGLEEVLLSTRVLQEIAASLAPTVA